MRKNNKDEFKNEYENKKGKIKRNDWRKLISFVISLIALYILLNYNVFEHTGYVLGLLLVAISGIVINYVIDKIFDLFM